MKDRTQKIKKLFRFLSRRFKTAGLQGQQMEPRRYGSDASVGTGRGRTAGISPEGQQVKKPRALARGVSFFYCLVIFLNYGLWTIDHRLLYADEKNWSGSGDGTSLDDPDNWFPSEAPAAADDLSINKKDAAVVASSDFSASSLSVGTKKAAGLTINGGVAAAVSPDQSSDNALSIGKDGTVDLKGAGIISLKGALKSLKTSTVVEEPAFMFRAE